MSEETIDTAETTTTRPMFLTVLCILTFIGSAYGIYSNFMGDGAKYMEMWYKIVLLLCNLATAYGAFLMWNLKRQGLLIWTAGEVIGLVIPFIYIYAILPSNIASFFGSIFLIVSIFPVAFIVMYWANAKHLS